MLCDHEATKATLRVFLAATTRHAFQDFGGDTVLMGNCRGCDTTLAVEVDVARGRVVRGELTTGAVLPLDDGAIPRHIADEETAEQHAARLIR